MTIIKFEDRISRNVYSLEIAFEHSVAVDDDSEQLEMAIYILDPNERNLAFIAIKNYFESFTDKSEDEEYVRFGDNKEIIILYAGKEVTIKH